MCGRFTLTTPADLLASEIGIDEVLADLSPRYNIAPSQDVLAVANRRQRSLERFRWGLIPSWAEEPSIGNRMINARAESLTLRPAFRGPFAERRCLVVADGFYEWRREGARKWPYYVRLKSRRPFAFAGLWDAWRKPDGGWIPSCAIVTTPPNALVSTLHDRMPAILPREAYDLWLAPGPQPPERLAALLAPYPAEEMEAYPVSPIVNSPDHDGPECIVPSRPEQASLF